MTADTVRQRRHGSISTYCEEVSVPEIDSAKVGRIKLDLAERSRSPVRHDYRSVAGVERRNAENYWADRPIWTTPAVHIRVPHPQQLPRRIERGEMPPIALDIQQNARLLIPEGEGPRGLRR